jgi:hypothetical protein
MFRSTLFARATILKLVVVTAAFALSATTVMAKDLVIDNRGSQDALVVLQYFVDQARSGGAGGGSNLAVLPDPSRMRTVGWFKVPAGTKKKFYSGDGDTVMIGATLGTNGILVANNPISTRNVYVSDSAFEIVRPVRKNEVELIVSFGNDPGTEPTTNAELRLTQNGGPKYRADSDQWGQLTRTMLMYEIKNGGSFTIR